jgi:arylsulfatase A-like enzyme
VFLARRALAALGPREPEPVETPRDAQARRRNILFITTDQQRFDSLGVTGHPTTRTPAIDALARAGLLYRRAHAQNIVCMPSRTTMLTGQHPLTHGVVANGISAPEDGPNVAAILREHGYHTVLIGKAHFDPHLDPWLRFAENRLALRRSRSVARLRARRARDARPDRWSSLRRLAVVEARPRRRRLRHRARR